MSIFDTTDIHQVIPFDRFDIETDRDRVVLPVSNPDFLNKPHVIVGDGFGGFRLDPPTFIMHTYERTPGGWRRVK